MIRERFESESVLEISEYQVGRKGWWWAQKILHIIINDMHFYQWRMIASHDYTIDADQTRISFSYNFLTHLPYISSSFIYLIKIMF